MTCMLTCIIMLNNCVSPDMSMLIIEDNIVVGMTGDKSGVNAVVMSRGVK